MVKYTPEGTGDGRLRVDPETGSSSSQSQSSNIWNSRTRLEKILLILLAIFAVAIISVSIILAKDKKSQPLAAKIQQHLPIETKTKTSKFCEMNLNFMNTLICVP